MELREMLELAALAAGIEGEWGVENFIERNEGFMRPGWRRAWDPPQNNEDSFELIVATAMLTLPQLVPLLLDEMGAPTYTDRETATRMAVLRCAAEMGKSIRAEGGAA